MLTRIRAFFQRLAYRIGVFNHTSILAPLHRIVHDLEVFIEHSKDEVVAAVEMQMHLNKRVSEIGTNIQQAQAARDKVAALVVPAGSNQVGG